MDRLEEAWEVINHIRASKHNHPFNVQTLQNMGPYEMMCIIKMKDQSCSSILEGIKGGGVEFCQRTKSYITLDEVKAVVGLIKGEL